MGNTPAGAKKAAETLRKKIGEEAYRAMKAKGGKATQRLHPEVANFRDPEFASKAGRISRPRKKDKEANQ